MLWALEQQILPVWAAHNISYQGKGTCGDEFPKSLLRGASMDGTGVSSARVGSVSGSAHHYIPST